MSNPPFKAGQPAERTLEVVYKAPGDLTPDPRNARTHSRKQVAQIVQSISAFGFTNPILADPEGNLIAGHGRLRAAKDMGLATVPVITLNGLTDPRRRRSGSPTTRSRSMLAGTPRS